MQELKSNENVKELVIMDFENFNYIRRGFFLSVIFRVLKYIQYTWDLPFE